MYSPTTSYAVLFGSDGVSYTSEYLSNLPSSPLSNPQCLVSNVNISQNGNEFLWSPNITLSSTFAAFGTENVYTLVQTQEGFAEWGNAATWNPSTTTPTVMGAAKVGIFRQGFEWILDANGNQMFDGTGPGQDFVYAYGGIGGDLPITGDWNGSGTAKVGIFRTHGGNLVFTPRFERRWRV